VGLSEQKDLWKWDFETAAGITSEQGTEYCLLSYIDTERELILHARREEDVSLSEKIGITQIKTWYRSHL